ncbi:amino acid ABC transporter substrate-binding protein [Vibrio sp. RE86]|uniref:substrate-binding periplasmic protein n=1 Tax=Vibrio sp. RE86 TaxID=2607605 RepID=UPI0014938DD8|nr:transporter substrate-binding domain-containing protein [Vibrio sp. RE86]NOH79656.1 amino acid ABC transporter substrate-binding protein [Vibrio sp. RE86]
MRLITLALLGINFVAYSAHSEQLKGLNFLTEQYPPYNYEQEGEIKGIAVELLQTIQLYSSTPDTPVSIQVQPWPRAYRTALIKPDTVLFSTTRTPLREEIFQWAGPISKTRIVVLAKKSKNISISHALELAQYRIGVIRDDVGEQLLLEAGVPRDSMVESSIPDTLAKQFLKDRIDLWAYEENVAKWWLKQAGHDPDDYEAVYVLSEGELYFAFNLGVDPATVEWIQQQLDMLKNTHGQDGQTQYQKILNQYQ